MQCAVGHLFPSAQHTLLWSVCVQLILHVCPCYRLHPVPLLPCAALVIGTVSECVCARVCVCVCVCACALHMTGALHWITKPYVHELTYRAADKSIEVKTTSLFGRLK